MVYRTEKSIVEGEVWGQDYKMQTLVYPRSQNIDLDGEATECRLYKQCGYMVMIT